jgi:hypothetical protein
MCGHYDSRGDGFRVDLGEELFLPCGVSLLEMRTWSCFEKHLLRSCELD